MGQTTLASFRSRLSLGLGDRDVGATRLEGWINDGYLDLCGAFDLIELRAVATATILGESEAIAVPDDLYWIRAVFNYEDEEELTKLASEYIHALDVGPTASPRIRYWSRDGRGLYVRPTYSADRELTLLYNREPTLLTEDSDTTEIPATFDRAVHLFALYAALSDLGEELRATAHRNNAIMHVRSRLDPADMEFAPGNHRGVRIIRSLADLKRRI